LYICLLYRKRLWQNFVRLSNTIKGDDYEKMALLFHRDGNSFF
jgi:hypothetical protein